VETKARLAASRQHPTDDRQSPRCGTGEPVLAGSAASDRDSSRPSEPRVGGSSPAEQLKVGLVRLGWSAEVYGALFLPEVTRRAVPQLPVHERKEIFGGDIPRRRISPLPLEQLSTAGSADMPLLLAACVPAPRAG
jgi:hypothetical protein